MNLIKIEDRIRDNQVKKDEAILRGNNLQEKISKAKVDLINIDKAMAIINQVAQETQAQLEFKVSELVSLALSSVWEEPYEFKLEFTPRRGKTEADLLFLRDGNIIDDPLDGSGGGALDIASWALRLACWNINNPKTRSLMVLDEPFKNLSKNRHEAAALMVRKISEKLGIQIIMNDHNVIFSNFSGSRTRVAISKKVSSVVNEK